MARSVRPLGNDLLSVIGRRLEAFGSAEHVALEGVQTRRVGRRGRGLRADDDRDQCQRARESSHEDMYRSDPGTRCARSGARVPPLMMRAARMVLSERRRPVSRRRRRGAKMSSARAICSGVCAAEQLARSTHSSFGQPGGTIRFTYRPSVSSRCHSAIVRSSSPVRIGTIGDSRVADHVAQLLQPRREAAECSPTAARAAPDARGRRARPRRRWRCSTAIPRP